MNSTMLQGGNARSFPIPPESTMCQPSKSPVLPPSPPTQLSPPPATQLSPCPAIVPADSGGQSSHRFL